MNSRKIIFIMLLVSLSLSRANEEHAVRRQKRKLPLMFNDFGVSQFVCGFGIPVDLDLETVTTGIVFKAQLPLPSKPMDLRNYTTHNVNGRLLDDSDGHHTSTLGSHVRWEMYKALELWAKNFGLNGKICVLKTICEATQIPFSIETGDLWQEVAHILFAPFSSEDAISDYKDNEYYSAAKIGLSHINSCDHMFKECPTSLLAFFSTTLS